jgi:hypothetical protein
VDLRALRFRGEFLEVRERGMTMRSLRPSYST